MAKENHNINAMELELRQKVQELQELMQENARMKARIAELDQKWQELQQKKQELIKRIAELQEAQWQELKKRAAQRKLQCQIDGARIGKKN